jgi:hypothetical protein
MIDLLSYLQLRSRLAKLDFVRASPHAFQSHLHNIPILQPKLRLPSHANALWCSREDQITRQQRGALTQERNRFRNTENHILRATFLNRLPIQLRRNLQILRILDDLAAHDTWTIRSPAVETFAERPLAAAVLELPVSVGDIVADCVAKNIIKC